MVGVSANLRGPSLYLGRIQRLVTVVFGRSGADFCCFSSGHLVNDRSQFFSPQGSARYSLGFDVDFEPEFRRGLVCRLLPATEVLLHSGSRRLLPGPGYYETLRVRFHSRSPVM